MKKSVWVDTVELPQFKSLEGDIKCDVLIIGGGLCGLLCGYYLKNMGVDCIVSEGDRIASGITKNTTAKITSQHGLIYSDIILSYGKEKAQMYLNANERAIEEYKKLAKNIECDFEIKDSYIYSLKSRAVIEREIRVVNALGGSGEFVQKTEMPFEVKGAVKFTDQAQFNPLKFIREICKDMNIYENTFVYKIEGKTAITDKGKIKAEKIIIATHFPFINAHGSYFLKLYQHRSYVSAFENAPRIKGMYADENKNGMSFKSYNDLLFIGGGGHRTGKKGSAWQEINTFAKEHYPKASPVYEWATQDCMSLDKIPYIGAYSKKTAEMYVATGFNKWGMTSSMVAAMILSDMAIGKKSEYEELFSPQRSMLKPQLLVNGIETTMNLLTPTVRRCPHLGCALKWNKAEQTWDCPCHGSRFNEDGKLIDNPAKKDADV